MVVEKQVIVQWYTPDEKSPEIDTKVVATINGRYKNINLQMRLLFLNGVMSADGSQMIMILKNLM